MTDTAAVLQVRHNIFLKPGQALYLQGDASGAFYRVEEGQLRLSILSWRDQPLDVDWVRPGNCLGEETAWGGPRMTTARASMPSKVAVLTGDMWLEAARVCGRRLRRIHEKIRTISPPNKKIRIAQVVNRYQGQSMTHGEIAQLAWVARESVTRTMIRFINEGLVVQEASRQYRVPDKEALLAYAGRR